MEVHLQGLAVHLPEESLQKHLKPVMAGLGIPDHAFTCEKHKKRTWAKVTFREESQGRAFLHKHGEQLQPAKPPRVAPARRPSAASSAHGGSINGSVKGFVNGSVKGAVKGSVNGSVNDSVNGSSVHHITHIGPRNRAQRKARLQFMGNDVFCSISKDLHDHAAPPGKPNQITLRGLQYAAEEKAKPTRQTKTEGPSEEFEVRSFSCGHNVFDGDTLVFVPEVEFEDTGTAKVTKQMLLIKLESRCVIKIPINTVVDFICSFRHVLTLTLSQEPSFFIDIGTRAGDLADSFQRLHMSVATGASSSGNEPTRKRVCALNERHRQVVGQCLVYQFQISAPDADKRILALQHHDVLSSSFVRYNLFTHRRPPLGLGPSRSDMSTLMQELSDYTRLNVLPFAILFQLQALAWNAYLHPGTVYALAKELRKLYKSDKDAGRRPISVDALKMLLKQINWPRPNGDASEFAIPSIIELLRENEDKFRSDSALRQGLFSPSQNLALVHRVTVTPSRITLHGPELEAKNRILRKFPQHHEFFVRVQFCDENGLDLFFSPKINYDEVYNRFKHILQNGIQIAGRTYSFLGFSHSSLRSHSAWFSAPFMDHNGGQQAYFNIISDLGSFKHIRSPARCAARIGQAFSETPYYVPLDDHNISIREIPDVESSDGKRVFSDGVGTMSWNVVYAIWDVIPQKKAAPTAVQVRFTGSKGMLAIDPSLDGSWVCIRPSMKKFESDDARNLEICDTASKPIPLVLNRQMVKILEDMGVNHSWFFRMQNKELTRLREVTADAYHVADFLKRQDVGEGIRLHRFFRQVENMGIDYRQDSFLCSVVEAIVLRELRLLKHKARIPIRKGVTLFGVMDETGFLQENQVYITYDPMAGRFDPPPGEGPLLVTRSPALHPGDIQFPHHVIPPVGHALREHTNVIVFSRFGARDLPSQLSGGDLDGDIYNVLWDAEAMPTKVFQPADYPRVPPLDLGREVTRDDMSHFFIDFIRQDILGVIAVRHMILADQQQDGTLNPNCLRLAELHSTAVDFSKTGIPVNMKELPRAHKYRPDFLAPGPEVRLVDKSTIELDDYILEPASDAEEDQYSGPRRQYYKSDKLLGHLYRAIDEKQIWHENVKCKVRPVGASFWDGFLNAIRPRYETVVSDPMEWVSHLQTAREIRDWYEGAVSDAMSQYSEHPVRPISELEVFIGNILNKSGVQTNRQRDNSIKLRDEFRRISLWITGQMRRVQHELNVPLTGYQTVHDNLNLCLACVYAGGERESGLQGKWYENMQSFRVVAACALLSELNSSEKRHTSKGGGYVGVRASGASSSTYMYGA